MTPFINYFRFRFPRKINLLQLKMATLYLSGNENELNCAICYQLYTEPRTLSGCPHSFCENCIVNFVLELKKEEKLGSEFLCPVCKLPSNSPGSDNSVHRWVTTLEVNEDIKMKCIAEIKPELRDTENCCSHCFGQEKVVVANKYCFSCNENYCATCSENIHSFKVNKGHLVMDREVSKQESTYGFHEHAIEMLNGFTACSKHPKEAVRFYCEDDKKFCCLVCSVDNHKQCMNLKPISVVAQKCTTVDSTKLLDLISKLTEHIDSRVEAIKENNHENKRKAEQLDVAYQEMKKKVIDLLDIMETNLRDEGKAAVKNVAVKNQDEIDDLESLKRKLKMVSHLLERIVKYSSGDLAFVYTLELERIVEDIEKSVIKKSKKLKTNGLELTTTETFRLIQNLGPNETPGLASISVPEAVIVLPVYENRPFLRKFDVKKTGTHRMLPAPYAPGKPMWPTYIGLLFLPNRQLLLVDSYYGYCCLVNEHFVPTKKWDMDDKLIFLGDERNYFRNERHATYLGDNLIAVSIASHKTIVFLTSDGNFDEKVKLKCEYEPKALCALNNGDIAVVWDKPVAFGIISGQIWRPCQGKVVQCNGGLGYCEKVYFREDNSGRKFKSFPFMAIDEKRGHVIQPCNVDRAVYCFDVEGNPVFHYKNDDLQNPGGVALDGEGNIYICEITLNSIHIVSAEGIAITSIKEDCPQEPLAIEYDMGNNVFAVTVYTTADSEEVHFFSVLPK